MKKYIIIIVAFLFIANLLFSITISVSGAFSENYLNDFRNYKSLKNPEKFMEIDSLTWDNAKNHFSDRNSFPVLIIDGTLQSSKAKIKMIVGQEKYFNYNLDKHAVYKSKSTNDYFLKDAPDGYHKAKLRSLFMKMYFKISLVPLLVLIIFLFKKYRNERI